MYPRVLAPVKHFNGTAHGGSVFSVIMWENQLPLKLELRTTLHSLSAHNCRAARGHNKAEEMLKWWRRAVCLNQSFEVTVAASALNHSAGSLRMFHSVYQRGAQRACDMWTWAAARRAVCSRYLFLIWEKSTGTSRWMLFSRGEQNVNLGMMKGVVTLRISTQPPSRWERLAAAGPSVSSRVFADLV